MTRRFLLLLTAAVAAAAIPSEARAGSRPWTSDDLLALRTVTDPQISPDGKWVVYVVSELDPERTEYQTDLWLVPAAGGEARRLTTAAKPDEFPRWSPDSKVIAFLSERPKPGAKKETEATSADEPGIEGKSQIWTIRPDGGEASILSDAKGGVSAFHWSRDGKSIAYLSREPRSDERRKKEKEKDDAWTPSMKYRWDRLWVMDVATRKAMQLTSGELHVSDFSFSPDGRRLVFAGQPTPLIPDQFASDLYVISTTGGRPSPLVQLEGADLSPSWSPDGKWIAFVSQAGRTTAWYSNVELCVVPAAGGPHRELTRDFDERVQGFPGGLAWSPDGSHLYFQSNQRTAQHLFRASLEGRVEPLTTGTEMNGSLTLDAAGSTAVFLREDSEHPREVHRLRFSDGSIDRLTDTNPQAREFLSFKKELVTWKGPDGLEIEGLLLTPPGTRGAATGARGRGRLPLVLNVHGGPAGTHSNTCTLASRIYPWPIFLQKGYAVLLPNPRGSGGYGERFRAANVRDWAGRDYQDLMAGVDALIERGLVDERRMAVCGWSYGGFMTSNVVTKTDRFRAAVVGAGVTDLISMAVTCDIPEFNRSYFDSWPWEDPAFYLAHSATLHVGEVRTPTLVVHGEKDERVPTSQGWELYTALKKVGVPTDLLLLPRQPHGPREPKLIKSVQEWQVEWINRYTLAPAAWAKPGTRKLASPGKPVASEAR